MMFKRMLVVTVVLAMPWTAFAVNYTWFNTTTNQNFVDPANWSPPGGTFTTSDSFYIDMDGTGAAIISSDAIGGSVRVGNAANSSGELLITGGDSVFNGSFGVGQNATAYGKLTISGGSTTFYGNYFTVAEYGTAEVEMTDGFLGLNRMTLATKAGAVSSFSISGGEITATTGDQHITCGAKGVGVMNISGTALITVGGLFRIGLGDHSDPNEDASCYVSGGTLSVGGDMQIGESSYGMLDMSGGTVSAATLNIGRTDSGDMFLSGGSINIAGWSAVGNDSAGSLEISGTGEFIGDRMQVGQDDGPGTLTITGGSLSLANYFTIGNENTGTLAVSGGTVHVDRSTLGQAATGVADVTISGDAQVLVDDNVQVGRDGVANLTLEGDQASYTCGSMTQNAASTLAFVLNGAAGVDNGILVRERIEDEARVGGSATLLGTIDPSFASGTEVGGSYIVLAASSIDDTNTGTGGADTLALSTAAETAGWEMDILSVGYDLLVVSYPGSGSTVAWTNGGGDQLWSTSGNWTGTIGVDDAAIIDLDGANGAILNSSALANTAVVGYAASGAMDVNTGANGQFVNMAVGAEAGSTGTVVVNDGTVTVSNAVAIGQEGDGSLTLSGGTFSAKNMVVGTGADSSSEVIIENDAALNVDGILGLGAGGSMTITSYQTSVNVGSFGMAEGSNLTLGFDGALGIGNGIVATGDVQLEGTISIEFLTGNRQEGTYTVLTTDGIILDNTGGDLVDTVFCDSEIVENAGKQELRIVIGRPTDCQDLIDNGYGLPYDFTEDCVVDIQDFAVFAAHWLWCNDPDPLATGCDWQLH